VFVVFVFELILSDELKVLSFVVDSVPAVVSLFVPVLFDVSVDDDVSSPVDVPFAVVVSDELPCLCLALVRYVRLVKFPTEPCGVSE